MQGVSNKDLKRMSFFNMAYRGNPPWDIGRVQSEFVKLEKGGKIKSPVLDAGCGTGDNALYLAGLGYNMTGIDTARRAIKKARMKVHEQNLHVEFRLHDALKFENLEFEFNTVIDSGLFHTFSDNDRLLFVKSLSRILQPQGYYLMLCFNELEPGTFGPRRVTQKEIRNCFNNGWMIEDIKEARYETNFKSGWSHAWLASIKHL
jgi:cyclopropane fatty-acyl-phospholipid synthase-like methyltransferase